MAGRKHIIITIIILILLAIPATITGLIYITAEHLVLEKEVVQIEYGSSKTEVSKEEFIGKSMSAKAIEQVHMNSPLSKETTASLAPGKYEVIFKYTPPMQDEEVERGYVIIADTTAPKFIEPPEELYIEQNAKDVKLENYFKIDDLSKVTTEVQNKYSLQVPNIYAISITAKDAAGNEANIAVKLTVVATEEVLEGKAHLTPYVSGDTPVSDETARAIINGTLADINTPKRQASNEKETEQDASKKPEKESKVEVDANNTIIVRNKNSSSSKDKDKNTDKNKNKDKKPVTEQTQAPVSDKCEAAIPAEGIQDRAKAIEQAENYIDMVGLTETHTYSLQEHDTHGCGKYYTYSIILKGAKE